MTSPPLASRQNTVLIPDPRRVIAELFVPGEDPAVVHTRAHALVDRIAALDLFDPDRTERDGYVANCPVLLRRLDPRRHPVDSVRSQRHPDRIRHRAGLRGPRSHDPSALKNTSACRGDSTSPARR